MLHCILGVKQLPRMHVSKLYKPKIISAGQIFPFDLYQIFISLLLLCLFERLYGKFTLYYKNERHNILISEKFLYNTHTV